MSIDNIKIYIGEQLRIARDKADMTQEQVAKAVSRDTNYYAKVERGKAMPSLTMLIKIADVLEVEYSSLFPKRKAK